ncbi:MAG: hypothetical protein ACI8TP_000648 [Acidimicrobiales bacterium]|jgi:hypothetical protein
MNEPKRERFACGGVIGSEEQSRAMIDTGSGRNRMYVSNLPRAPTVPAILLLRTNRQPNGLDRRGSP